MSRVLDVLRERGFLKQVTDEATVRELLSKEGAKCYNGFDPTAESLHAGSLLPLMALMHMERAGYRPIALVGGGTAMVGDPSGKTEMRQMLTEEAILRNGEKIAGQLGRYLDFQSGRSLLVNNADWLKPLKQIEFLRDIGRHFSVNRMLAAEAYKSRMETGLSFLELSYQIFQAYDFLVLFQEYGCQIQMGGDDQWGNIVAGTDLIRRVTGGTAEGVTFPLLLTASGQKMGKTAQGAVWLDPAKTKPHDFFQYWINVHDQDVARFLMLFTFLPIEEIEELCAESGEKLKPAKEKLAFEATTLTHGSQDATRARTAATSLFVTGSGEDDGVPSTSVPRSQIEAGWGVVTALASVGLCASKGEARRLIQGGGAYVNGEQILDVERMLGIQDAKAGHILLRAGKKKYHRIDVI